MAGESLTVRVEESGARAGVATIVLEQPGRPVVVLDRGLIEALDDAIGRVPSDAKGVVLASVSERVFVAGADLKSISELDDDGLMAYLAYGSGVFGKLSQLPCATVAAINGAALGGGMELAMHCDGLAMAPSASGKPYLVGLPEAGLAICPGWGGTNLLAARMDPSAALAATASGAPMKSDKAVGSGMFDVVSEDPGGLWETAADWVLGQETPSRDGAPSRWIGREGVRHGVREALDSASEELSGSDPGRAVVEAVRAGLDEGWDAALLSEQRSLTRLRGEPVGVEAIRAFFERSAKK